MTYLTIDIDGTLTVHHGYPTAEVIRQEIGDWDMVAMPQPSNRMRGFVNDTGFLAGLFRKGGT